MTSSLFEPVDDFISRAGQLGLELDRPQKLLSSKSSPEEPELLNVFPRAYFESGLNLNWHSRHQLKAIIWS